MTSSYTDLQDYTYYFVPAPWLSVKLLRLLQNYPPPEDPSIRTRLTDCLETILNKAQVGVAIIADFKHLSLWIVIDIQCSWCGIAVSYKEFSQWLRVTISRDAFMFQSGKNNSICLFDYCSVSYASKACFCNHTSDIISAELCWLPLRRLSRTWQLAVMFRRRHYNLSLLLTTRHLVICSRCHHSTADVIAVVA